MTDREKLEAEVAENIERLAITKKTYEESGLVESARGQVLIAETILENSKSRLQTYIQKHFKVGDGVTLNTFDGSKYSYTIIKKAKKYLLLQKDKVAYKIVFEDGKPKLDQHIEPDYYGAILKVKWDKYSKCYCHLYSDFVYILEGRTEQIYCSKDN